MPKSVAECHLTDISQKNSSTESGFSSTASSPAVAVRRAEKERPPPLTNTEWVMPLVGAKADATVHSSEPLGVDGSGAAAKDAICLPMGSLKPTMAAALRQGRLSLATDGGAVPTAPEGSVPRRGEAPFSSPTGSDRGRRYSASHLQAAPSRGAESSMNFSFNISSSYSPTSRAAPPLRRISTDSAKDDAVNGTDAAGSKMSDGGRRRRCASRTSESALFNGIRSCAGSPDGDGLHSSKGAPNGAARSVRSPPGASVSKAAGASPSASFCSGLANYVLPLPHPREKGAMDDLQSAFTTGEQRPGSPSVSGLFRHGGVTSLMNSNLRRQSWASRSMPYDLHSMLVSEATGVPLQEEESDVGGHMAFFQDRGTDGRKGDDWAGPAAGAGGGDHRIAAEPSVSVYSDASAGLGLQRTYTLFGDVFGAMAKDVKHTQRLAAPEMPHGMMRAPSLFGLSAAQENGDAEGQALYSDDSREVTRDGDGEAPPAAISAQASDSFLGDENCLRDFTRLPVCAPHPPPDPVHTSSYQRPARALSQQTSPPLPAVVTPRAGATGGLWQAPGPHGPLPSYTQCAASPRTLTVVAMRHMAPQPLIYGPPLPPQRKLDPRLVFGRDFLAEAPWVYSPRDADLDSNVPTLPAMRMAPYGEPEAQPPKGNAGQQKRKKSSSKKKKKKGHSVTHVRPKKH
ncbi:proteophosphoglycan ppg4 [Strigomonas culicis]|uniref:Proteophosphoglycan ppg4 n=1 Tax=Strigomonas culicis TaxID=28005 RepID=S9TPH5_9TRYP|nr:proteophosphoglycan ppg4 [Strigomonas culicis]|eukprot:EPY18358.1 proteophosphoglycan ppg4 [Strigomonas culicis]